MEKKKSLQAILQGEIYTASAESGFKPSKGLLALAFPLLKKKKNKKSKKRRY